MIYYCTLWICNTELLLLLFSPLKTSVINVFISRAVVLSQGQFCPPGDICQCLETFVIVTARGGGGGNKPSPQVRTQARCQTELWASHGARGRGPGSPEKTVSSGTRKHRITSYLLFSVVNWKVFMEAIPHYFQKFPFNTHLLKIFYFPDTVSDALRTVCGQDQDFYPCG